jgi:hypothetical protein
MRKMADIPSKEDNLKNVRSFVASFAQLSLGEVKPGLTLKGIPIRLDDNQLVFLATSLRGYVKGFNPEGTVKAADTRKDGQTVQGIADVCFEQITSSGD